MRTFAQKPKATQQTMSAKSTMPARTHFEQSHEVNSILQLQRTIGNQAVQRVFRTDAQEPKAGLTGPALPRFGHDFSRIPIHPPAAGAIQTKLAVNELGDSYEQDADRIAEQVMRTPEPQLQRACPCGGGCPNCHTEQPGWEHESLQTKRVQASDTGQIAAPPIVNEVLRSPGQPLDPATRDFMETRFGHDFSRVLVHSDAAAEQSARDVKAHAYTVGNHIVFGTGQLAPQTSAGKRLLAHELTHVVQQSGATSKTVQRAPDGATDIDGTYDVEWKFNEGTAQVVYGKKSATISLGSAENAAKLSRELGITKPQAAKVLREIRANVPHENRLLISFVQNAGNPREYAIRRFREMRAGGLWHSDALARPPVEGIRQQVRVPGAGGAALELSEYGYVFFEAKDHVFVQNPSGTAQGIQEFQHLNAAKDRTPALTSPVAIVRVDEYGKIVEVVEHALAGSPDEVRGKLIREFKNAGWKADFAAPAAGAAGAPLPPRAPIDAHKPADMGKKPSPMDVHTPQPTMPKPQPTMPKPQPTMPKPQPTMPKLQPTMPKPQSAKVTAELGAKLEPVIEATPGFRPAAGAGIGGAFQIGQSQQFSGLQGDEIAKFQRAYAQLQPKIDRFFNEGYSVEVALVVEKPVRPDVFCGARVFCDSGQFIYFRMLFITRVESTAPPRFPTATNHPAMYPTGGRDGFIPYPHQGGSIIEEHEVPFLEPKHADHHCVSGKETLYPPPKFPFAPVGRKPAPPPVRIQRDPSKDKALAAAATRVYLTSANVKQAVTADAIAKRLAGNKLFSEVKQEIGGGFYYKHSHLSYFNPLDKPKADALAEAARAEGLTSIVPEMSGDHDPGSVQIMFGEDAQR